MLQFPATRSFDQSIRCNFTLPTCSTNRYVGISRYQTFRPINALFQRRNKSTSSLFSSLSLCLSFLFSFSLFSFLFVVVNLPEPMIRLSMALFLNLKKSTSFYLRVFVSFLCESEVNLKTNHDKEPALATLIREMLRR